MVFLTTALEVSELAERAGQPVDRAAPHVLWHRRPLCARRDARRRPPPAGRDAWQKAAADSLIDDFYGLQAELAVRVLTAADGAADPLAAWAEQHAELLASADVLASELRGAGAADLAMLVVARQQLRQALG